MKRQLAGIQLNNFSLLLTCWQKWISFTAYTMRKRFCRSKDSIISGFALPTRCSCMFYLLNVSSYIIHHHRKSIYLLTFWNASNKKIYLSSQASEWNVVSMGPLCKNSSFVLKTKNTTDGHFTGLHIPVTAMGPPHFTNISMITAHGWFTCGQGGWSLANSTLWYLVSDKWYQHPVKNT